MEDYRIENEVITAYEAAEKSDNAQLLNELRSINEKIKSRSEKILPTREDYKIKIKDPLPATLDILRGRGYSVYRYVPTDYEVSEIAHRTWKTEEAIRREFEGLYIVKW